MKENYLPPNFVDNCRENANNCPNKCTGDVIDVYVKGEHVLASLEDGKIINCPIFYEQGKWKN